MLKPRPAAVAALAMWAGAAAGCGPRQAVGDVNTIAVIVPDAGWAEIEQPLRAALEPKSFTVREERVFDVAHADPAEARRRGYLRLRQLLVVGSESDQWVADALDAYSGEVPAPPAILSVTNVWARPQLVTVLLLPPGSPPSAAIELLPKLGTHYLDWLERYARERMFVTGENTSLADSLRRFAGYTLSVPRVYRADRPAADVLVLRNDQPDPSQLIRTVTVDARRSDVAAATPEAVLAWRRRLAQETTTPPQVTLDEDLVSRPLEVGGRAALEVRGVWSNPAGEWPAAGPFITRLVHCPAGPVLVDAWLYAPGQRKFEYVVQLETILESFRCATG